MNNQLKTQRGSTTTWTIGVIVVLIIGLIVLGKYTGKPAGPVSGTTDILSSVTSADWTRDNPNAALTLTEYSDLECPACRAYYYALKEIHAQYGTSIKFVYRHFPLAQHRNARFASRAAEAAGKQGKFWEMHDALFETQEEWTGRTDAQQTFETYAEALGLNVEQFKTDYASDEIIEKVSDHYASGIKYGVASTPTFFINNERQSFSNVNDLVAALESALSTTTTNGTATTTSTTTP